MGPLDLHDELELKQQNSSVNFCLASGKGVFEQGGPRKAKIITGHIGAPIIWPEING